MKYSEQTVAAYPTLAFVSNPLVRLRSYLSMSDGDKGTDLIERNFEDFKQWLQSSQWEEHQDVQALLEGEIDAPELPLGLRVEYYQDNPLDWDAPGWSYFEGSDIVKNQWLIHFTGEAKKIAERGFLYGTDDLEDLGVSDGPVPGGTYCFAYRAKDFKQYLRGGKSKYGHQAVIFRASGVRTWHLADKEEQVIFACDQTSDRVPVLYSHQEGYSISDKPTIPKFSSIEDTVEWVMTNYNQYKRVLK